MRTAFRLACHNIIAIILLLTTAGVALAQSADRLPQDVTPLHYRLNLTIDPDAETFLGRVEIDVELEKSANTITLHGEKLTVTQATIQLADGTAIEARYEENPDNGLATLNTVKPVPAGKVTLRLSYSAELAESLVGLYRSRHDGHSYVYTQMQAIYARQAFPSFDEPRFKHPLT